MESDLAKGRRLIEGLISAINTMPICWDEFVLTLNWPFACDTVMFATSRLVASATKPLVID